MAEDISHPLLALVKEQWSDRRPAVRGSRCGEFKRSGKPICQILQDFGIMDLDTILQVMAESPRHGGGHAQRTRIHAGGAPDDPGQHGADVPVRAGRHVRRHAAGGPGRSAEPGADRRTGLRRQARTFSSWSPIPRRSQKAIDKYLRRGGRRKAFRDILKELGADADIAKEVDEPAATDDAT